MKKGTTQGFRKPYSTDQSVSEQHDAWISFRCKLVPKSYIHTCSTQLTAPGLSRVEPMPSEFKGFAISSLL